MNAIDHALDDPGLALCARFGLPLWLLFEQETFICHRPEPPPPVDDDDEDEESDDRGSSGGNIDPDDDDGDFDDDDEDEDETLWTAGSR